MALPQNLSLPLANAMLLICSWKSGMHDFELLNITPGWGDAQTDTTDKVADKPCFLTAAASWCVHTSRC